MSPPWTDLEAAALLGSAFALQRHDATISKALNAVYRRNPRVATVAFLGFAVWFAVHIVRYPGEVS